MRICDCSQENVNQTTTPVSTVKAVQTASPPAPAPTVAPSQSTLKKEESTDDVGVKRIAYEQISDDDWGNDMNSDFSG